MTAFLPAFWKRPLESGRCTTGAALHGCGQVVNKWCYLLSELGVDVPLVEVEDDVSDFVSDLFSFDPFLPLPEEPLRA